MSIEEKLAKWAEQPGAVVTEPERQFIENMRKAASAGVGYGYMQQVIEWEWQSVGPAALGPEYYGARIRELEEEIEGIHQDAAGASI